MQKLKTKVDDLIFIIKQENPNANWKNLITGTSILVLVTVFSVWYFDTPAEEPDLFQQLRRNPGLQVDEDFTTNGKGTDSILGVGSVIGDDVEEYTIVQKSEGLWHVAKRVCGDGEKYKYLAEANNLNVRWAKLAVGQKLKIDCGE